MRFNSLLCGRSHWGAFGVNSMSIKVNYSSVEERDMDTLFLEAIGSDKGFLQLFTNEIEVLKERNIEVDSIELSKSDSDGESDITVIVECENTKYGLLIEDKINAIAMPDQCKRYSVRGKKGIKNGDYSNFFVFIVSPEKYYEQDEEAKKYEYFVSYEKCKKYLESKDDLMSKIWVQQFEQSIEKSKKQSSVNFNEARNKFFKQYLAYQRENYPNLECVNNEEKAGTGCWPHFKADPKNAYILHKTPTGTMDLTFARTAGKKIYFEVLEKWIEKMGFTDIKAVETGKSMTFRKSVPEINFNGDFEQLDKSLLDKCFDAGYELLELAKIINYFTNICEEDR